MALPEIYIPPFVLQNTPCLVTVEISTKLNKKTENLAVVSFNWELTADLG